MVNKINTKNSDFLGKLLFCTNNGPVNVIQSEHLIECIAFAPSTADLKLLACGSLEGQISIWDYSKYALRTVCESPVPFDGILRYIFEHIHINIINTTNYFRLKWLNDYTLLAATAQGKLNAFDARTGSLKFTLTGHLYHIYECAFKWEENCLLTVSEDNTAKVFKLPPLGE